MGSINIQNSITRKILRIIGSPFAASNPEFDQNDIPSLYQYATKNRMPLHFLQALNKIDRLGSYTKEYNRLGERDAQIVRATSRVAQTLERNSANYAFFKSIRPYQEVTVDLDILIFDPEYQQIITNMPKAGYTHLETGPLSATFRDSKGEINIDLYNEIGASHIIYLDKQKFKKSIIDKKLVNGKTVRTLDPCSDLIALVAHSVLKEQMYVLSEYYTTLHTLANIESTNSNRIISMAEESKIRKAFQTHLGLSALVHQQAHGFIPDYLVRLINEKDLNRLECERLKAANYHVPFKYHPITVAQAFMEKIKEPKARRSFATQISNAADLKFATAVTKQLLNHMIRETY